MGVPEDVLRTGEKFLTRKIVKTVQNSGHNFNLHLLYPDVYHLLSIRLRKATPQNKRATNKSKVPLFEKEFYQSATPLL